MTFYPVAGSALIVQHHYNEIRRYGLHEGLDLEATADSSIIAYDTGMVVMARLWEAPARTGLNAYGNLVGLDHGDFSSWYAHVGIIGVTPGEIVQAGSLIAHAGSTGFLHFMLTCRTNPDPVLHVWHNVVDPYPYLLRSTMFACSSQPARVVTNQDVINLLYKQVAPAIGMTGAQLIRQLGWGSIYSTRGGLFNPARLNRQPLKTPETAWTLIKNALTNLLASP